METEALLFIFLVCIQGRFVIGGLSGVRVTDSPSDTTYLEADKFLKSYGYYPSSDLLLTEVRNPSLRKHSDTERTKALKSLRKVYHIPQSGELNKETTQRSPRFGDAYIVPKEGTVKTSAVVEMEKEEHLFLTRERINQPNREESGIKFDRRRRSLDLSRKSRVKRNVYLSPDGTLNDWRFDDMRWKITRPSKHRSLRAQRKILKMAMARWEKIVPVKFLEEKEAPEAHMHILFHSFASKKFDDKMHRYSLWVGQQETIKDMPNFTRPSSGKAKRKSKQKRKSYTIAHASVPKSYRYSLQRDIHFDEDHKWSRKEFFSVALHEIGHALGLADSHFDETAVMFEFNRGNTAFSSDDFRAALFLYGYRMKSDNPYLCNYMLNAVDYIFKALLYPRAQIYYFILGGDIKLLSESHLVNSRQHGSLEAVFKDSPSKFDVIFSDRARTSVFIIKGSKLYQYIGAVDFKLKKIPFWKVYFPETPKFAVTMDSPAGESTILFGYKYWWFFEFDGEEVPMTKHQQRFSSRISKLLKSAKFAVRWTDGEVYVIMRNDSYFTLEFSIFNKTTGSPLKKGKPAWMVRLLCRGHATTVRISRPSLMLLIVLSLIKLF